METVIYSECYSCPIKKDRDPFTFPNESCPNCNNKEFLDRRKRKINYDILKIERTLGREL